MDNSQKNNIDCPSPFSRPITQQYPSQSANFISLEQTPNRQFNNQPKNQSWNKDKPKFYRNPHENSFSAESPRNFTSPYHHGKYGDSQRKRPFNSHNKFRDNSKKQFVQTKGDYDFSLYYHPSMIQDPWQNLMKRHEALSSNDNSIKK